jgi:DNA-binding transcriptional MerR regulator
MFTIGEFSRITGLTVKTLRFYHEQGVLVPSFIDARTGYRHYDESQIETARVVRFLRELEFSIDEISQLVRSADAEERLLDAMERQRLVLESRMRRIGKAVRLLRQFISDEREVSAMSHSTFEVQEKALSPMLVAGIRMKGRYAECGKAFGRLCRSFGRYLCGKPLLLHYDSEYREEDADFEACVPIRRGKEVEGASVRELPGGRCVSLMHKGPYDQLGRSYALILGYVRDKGYRALTPTREVYIKGPGMIFRGNPKNYLTEIQMLVEGEGSHPTTPAATQT